MAGGDFAKQPGAALVTGGTGAIGAAVTTMLARRGSRVVFTYRGNAEAAAALSAELAEIGAESEARQLDLTDADAAVATLDAVDERFGGIHTIVYPRRASATQWRGQGAGDAMALYDLVQRPVGRLRRTRGSIVAVATTALSRAIVRDGLSVGPKGAVEGVVRTLAVEEGRFGVRANVVGVGMTSVGMAAELLASGEFGEGGEAAMASVPLRRFGRAEDVAEAVCFLASDRASFISGQTLNVDGGYSA